MSDWSAKLQNVLSMPPASFSWSRSEDGTRTIGTSAGIVVDLLPDRVEVVATFPPDNARLAARNGQLMTLVLVGCRPDWTHAPAWLAMQMRLTRTAFAADTPHRAERVTFAWMRKESRASLVIEMP